MTLCTNLDDICQDISNLAEDDKAGVGRLQGLIKTYFNALHNPPLGVLGVGAITYAEAVLIQSQQEVTTK
jgi:hypothetical protein